MPPPHRDSEHTREQRNEVRQIQQSETGRQDAVRRQDTNSLTNAQGGTGARGSKRD